MIKQWISGISGVLVLGLLGIVCGCMQVNMGAGRDIPPASAQDVSGLYFASGVKVGEVTQDSAIFWVRLSEEPEPRFGLLPVLTEGNARGSRGAVMPPDTVPGAQGQVRVRYGTASDVLTLESDWQEADADGDYSCQIPLKKLKAGTAYSFAVEARKGDKSPVARALTGGFHTAFPETSSEPVRFIVTTGQSVRTIDAGKDGHVAYKHMLDWKPHFFVHTGDILYYDNEPFSRNLETARAKWSLMFGYGHNRNFHRYVSSYFMKDDHDTLKNDCWPGQTYGDLTFDQGLAIFREQVPMGEKTYRTIRWGRDVQIWLTENRDFRSPNTMKDGPDKTILGAAQKAWLKKTLKASTATYKFVISPGPIVGPDKPYKSDNHSNPVFSHEGQELRDFLSGLANTYVIAGDRHWQYCSKDPKTGLVELGCGPINTKHNYGGSSGLKPMHRYFGKKGGFLGITVEKGQANAEWFVLEDGRTEGPLDVGYTEKL